jgi:hypothetical protein
MARNKKAHRGDDGLVSRSAPGGSLWKKSPPLPCGTVPLNCLKQVGPNRRLSPSSEGLAAAVEVKAPMRSKYGSRTLFRSTNRAGKSKIQTDFKDHRADVRTMATAFGALKPKLEKVLSAVRSSCASDDGVIT